jgi:two-component system, LuxR family, response regulator FixJ
MSGARVVSIVDDDESVRQAIHGLLRSVALPVAAFASVEEFLRSDHLQRTGCLILDLRMPDMDGLELQRRLADDGHRIPIIVFTAHGDAEARARALEAGAAVFLRKPADPDALLAAVESCLVKGRGDGVGSPQGA